MNYSMIEYKALLGPVMSEKSIQAADKARCFVFKVRADVNKLQVRYAVEKMFDVKVEHVNMVNVKGKRKRFKFRPGQRSGVRKAYVKLAEGYDIKFAQA